MFVLQIITDGLPGGEADAWCLWPQLLGAAGSRSGAAVFSCARAAWQLTGEPGPPESVPREGWRPAAGVYPMLGVCPHWPKWPIPQNVPEPTVLWEEQRCLLQTPSAWVSCFGDPRKLSSRRAQWLAPGADSDAAGRGLFLTGKAPERGGGPF